MFACAKAGAILHPISWRLAPAEVAFQLDDAEPAFFLIEDEYRELGEAALALASVRPALHDGRLGTPDRAGAPSDDDPLLLIYTSGTTGKPKGALLTHGELLLDEPLVRPRDGHQARRRGAAGAAPVPLRRLERAVDPRLVEGSQGRARARLRPGPRARPDRARAGHDADGRPRELPLHGAGATVRRGRPELAQARCRRRCPDAGGAARHLGGARRRHRAGLRPHRGRTERALPAAGGRAAQGGLRRQAVPVRHL